MYAFSMTLGGVTLDQIEDLDDGEIDLKELSSVIDRLQIKFCRVVAHGPLRTGELPVGGGDLSSPGAAW
jgi:hypothetical protein